MNEPKIQNSLYILKYQKNQIELTFGRNFARIKAVILLWQAFERAKNYER